jgi:DNA-binding Xre family transcriptional regulator
MKNNRLEEAQEALKQIFEIERIKQVVCVDDQYREFPDDMVNDVIGFLETREIDSLQETFSRVDDFRDVIWDDEDIRKEQIRKIWYNAHREKREALYDKISKLFPQFADNNNAYNNNDMDIEHARTLRSILTPSVGVEFKEISFAGWKKSGDEYLEDKIVNQTLFLFDQDLSKEGGTDREGIKIIKSLLGKNKEIRCGLLSHTFSPNDEYKDWKKFADDYSIVKDRFVLISKMRLNEDKPGFVRMIRLTVMNKYCEKLKDKVRDIIEDTFKKSKKEIDDLNIYDFEEIVFRSSYEEGIWEPDTLFRLYNLYQKKNARKLALQDDDLRSYTDKIREISSIPIEDYKRESKLWEIQRHELYEDEHINQLHMPIELGDIFRKTNGEKKYILIAQPCNLMVRAKEPKGKRAYDFHEAVMAEIVKKPSPPDDSCYKLLYFDRQNGDNYFVDFKKTHSVLLCVLDLCVYNKEGLAKMSVGDVCPDLVIPSWCSRFEILKRKVEKIIKKYKENKSKGYDESTLNLLLPKGLFKAAIEVQKGKDSIRYNCQRIGRLCQPRSGEMLTKYAQYISRSAFEHDFERFHKKRIANREEGT